MGTKFALKTTSEFPSYSIAICVSFVNSLFKSVNFECILKFDKIMMMMLASKSVIQVSATPKLIPKIFKLQCMYTKQINKKRKVWSDGILKLSIDGSIHNCTLLDTEDVREIGLGTRPLEPSEIARFDKRIEHHLEIDQYLIQVTFEREAPSNGPQVLNRNTPNSKPLIPKKFVPPSRYVPPQPIEPNETFSNYSNSFNRAPPTSSSSSLASSINQSNSIFTSTNIASKFKKYDVQQDELDDIWNDAPKPTHSFTTAASSSSRAASNTFPHSQQIANNIPVRSATSFHNTQDEDEIQPYRPATGAYQQKNTAAATINDGSTFLSSRFLSKDRDNYHLPENDEYDAPNEMSRGRETQYVQVNAPNRHLATLSRQPPQQHTQHVQQASSARSQQLLPAGIIPSSKPKESYHNNNSFSTNINTIPTAFSASARSHSATQSRNTNSNVNINNDNHIKPNQHMVSGFSKAQQQQSSAFFPQDDDFVDEFNLDSSIWK